MKDYYQEAYNGSLDSIIELVCRTWYYKSIYDEVYYWIKRLSAKEDVALNWSKYSNVLSYSQESE